MTVFTRAKRCREPSRCVSLRWAITTTCSVLPIVGSVTQAMPHHIAEHGTVILVAEPGIDFGLEPGEGSGAQPKVHAAAAGATTVPSSRVPSRSNTTAFGRIRAAPSLLNTECFQSCHGLAEVGSPGPGGAGSD